jgi:hypothetical protein
MKKLLCVLLLCSSPAAAQTQSSGVAPYDCSVTILGVAKNVWAVAADGTIKYPPHGFRLQNNNTAEPIWWSMTGTAAAATAGSFVLPPGTAVTYAGTGGFDTPTGFGTRAQLSVIATTNPHILSCMAW